MGKITKPMQAKHKETLSPWLATFVQEASSTPLPVLPKLLAEFPSRWPFGRGDLYHWTTLLNLFDEILEQFCKTYKLAEGPQTRDFGCELLLNQHLNPAFEGGKQWTQEELTAAGIAEDGDSQLIVTVLTFTRMLLENCGNRSIYASSNHLNNLLNTTSLNILVATLEVGYELAQRYQASVKRIPHASRHVSSALLANHYNIELDRVHQLALPFVKTPLIRPSDTLAASSPNPLVKGKDKSRQAQHRNQATTHANDLTAIVDSDGALWKGWADVKVSYYPETVFGKSIADEVGNTSMPTTPTPLRRSSTMTPQQSSSRSRNFLPDDASPLSPRTPGTPQAHLETGEKSFEVPHSVVTSSSIYDLLQRLPADMPAAARYEAFHRLRVAKALTGSREQRQALLATRLLAITNLAYIHTESNFIERVLRYDIDETRRFQLVYQLAELIRPQTESNTVVPLWLQTISLALLEVVAPISAKTSDVVAALNANVNHGILLYIVRKAVAGMKEDDPSEDDKKITPLDQWRRKLLSLTNNMALQLRVGPEMVSAGLMEILVELLKIRSKVAQRYHNSVLTFLDNLVWNYQNAFTTFFNMNGLDVVAQLVVDAVAEARVLQANGKGTPADHRSSAVDYSVPYYQQQTLKGLLKFVHHILSNSFSFSGNTDRLLRNLVDKADLLRSLKTVIEDKQAFGSVAWTYTVTLLSDFINNDPTSFAAISESGMIKTYLEAITGRQVPDIGLSELAQDQEAGGEASSPDTSAIATQADDDRPHPPTEESLRQSKRTRVAEGILPSAEAMSVIPQVLNSICLNNAGMKSVIASRAFDSFLEIFESPEHVKCMQDESDHDNAGNLGASFDELARHHPALRLAISHAVIDMVARVRFLGIEKSESAGWGARLHNVDGSDLESRGPAQLNSGSDTNDVDMSGSGAAIATHDTEQTDAQVAEDDLTPYVIALGNFLAAYFGNLDLKGAFIDHGGIELLLDILGSPGLSHTFSGSYGSKIMVQVVSILLEHAPVRGLPAVLNRAQDAVDILKPLADQRADSPAYFRRFIAVQSGDAQADRLAAATVEDGSNIVKAWLYSHQLFRILAESFTAGRHQTLYFLPVNVYDLYLKLVTSLGPLIQGIIAEEAAERDVVPKHWRPWSRFAGKESNGQEQTTDELIMSEPESANDASRSFGTTTASNSAPAEPTAEERKGSYFRNYRLLCTLQQIMVPQAYPLLQSLGKALLNRRDPIHNSDDVYARARQLDIIKSMGRMFLTFLQSSLEDADKKNQLNLYRYWVRMLHALQQVLVDRAPSRDRGGSTLTLPILLAFKESHGFDALNRMLSSLADGVKRDDQDPEVAKYATSAISQILDVYSALTHSKVIIEACGTYALQWPRERAHISATFAPQFVLEFRAIVLPQITKLWQSSLMERLPDTLVKRILETLKVVTQSEHEALPTTEAHEPYEILKYDDARFNWTESRRRQVEELKQGGRDEDLALEAVFRANGDMERARLYCHLHAKGLATSRAPVPEPEIDAYKTMPQTLTTPGAGTDAPTNATDTDEMSVDQPLDDPLDAVLARMQEGAGAARESEPSSTVMVDAASAGTVHHPFASIKKELDEHRALLKENLIDRCLDITRAHPDIVLDVADLIQASIAQQPRGSSQEDVGSTLTSALTSLACDEDDKTRNARCIAGYAHLLAVLLRDEKFLDLNTETLQSNVDEYVTYLRILPVTAEALPPWIPAILLILELLLCRDARPAELQWAAPKTLDDEVEKPTLRPRTTLISTEQRNVMLEYVLDLLPRVGKDSGLAVAALRILVILTRDRQLAKVVGDKRNLQRLFLMAKQLSGFGSDRMRQTKVTSHILIILRHIIEDEETIKQVMREEMINEYPQLRHQSGRRDLDVASFVKGMSSTALRDPDLFVEVMADVFEFSRWVAPSQETSRTHYLVLKDSKTTPKTPFAEADKDSVKPTTETPSKEVVGTSKATDSKRPVVDHPDGVVHFLLCELLAYRDVEDVAVSSSTVATEGAASAGPPSKQETSGQAGKSAEGSTTDSRDKKQTRPAFKAEDNPLFIYRCFILSCLTELLQSYNKAKIEFINFKRSAPPLSATTPVKPRSTVLNYLIYDLLCQSTLSGSADTLDAKKRMATASHTQRLLVALVSRPKERTLVPEKDKFSVDEDPDLLFVRKFVLDIILKAYEKTPSSDLSMESRYSRLQSLAELMNHMIGGREKDVASSRGPYNGQRQSQAQLRRLMYEKGYLDKLTSSIADINLNFPGVKRAIKYILRVLHTLTDTAKELSQANILPSDSIDDGDGDSDLASSSSLSSLDDSDREETPDLYRNSALGMLEPRGEDEDSDSDEDEDDEEMYGDDYDEEMDYGDETLDDAEDNISDEDEDITHMGEIEGLHGEPGVVEVIMDDEGDDQTSSEDSDDDEDDVDSDDMEEVEDNVEILEEEGHPMDDDGGSGWEDDSDEDDDEDDVDDEDIDYEADGQDAQEAQDFVALPHSFDNLARVMLGEADPEGMELGDYDDQYQEDDHDEEDDDDDEDEDDLEDEYIYDDYPAAQQGPPVIGLGWDGLDPNADGQRPLFMTDHPHRSRFVHGPFRSGGVMSGSGRMLAQREIGDFRNFFTSRGHRGPSQPAAQAEDGLNPLLRRNTAVPEQSARRRSYPLPEWSVGDNHSRHDWDGTMAILGEIAQQLPAVQGRRGDVAFHLRFRGPMGLPERDFPSLPRPRVETRRESGEPQHSVGFPGESTADRYQEEARMVFGRAITAEANKLVPLIAAQLLPAAMDLARRAKAEEAERRKQEEEERRKKEEERAARAAREAEEKAAREKEEQARQAASEAAAREAAANTGADVSTGSGQDISPMEGVESSEAGRGHIQTEPSGTSGAASEPRVVTMINGEEVDVTELGIDPDYLAALPEEFRAEVIAQAVSSRRSQAMEEATTGESTEVFREFLEALPDELRMEIEQQERQDQRRRVRDDNRRQATPAAAQDIITAADMDPASILMTFPPALREQVLMDQGSELMDQLPPEMAAQARALSQHMRSVIPSRSPPRAQEGSATQAQEDNKEKSRPQRRAVIKMLDKAGVATLLRLMFITQQGSIRSYLFNVFADVCENRQNRLEVVSSVLQILQEGSVDMHAVERSFGQLSLKARKQNEREREGEQRTPQSIKRTLTSLNVHSNAQTNSETSPLLIIQQCLDLLVDLSGKNPHVPYLFLTEHEIVGSTLKRALSRKAKGKDKDTRSHKFAINSLLSLLDRELVLESSVVMTHLADLLNRVTLPLQNLERRRKEALEAERKNSVVETTVDEPTNDASEAATANAASTESTAPKNPPATSEANTTGEDSKKKLRLMPPPIIPSHNLTLVVRIFVARECSSKTFQNTISTIKNLSVVEGAKDVFGEELVSQALLLSQNIVADLDELLPQIEKAASGTEIQGVALDKFSPGASEQNKLLRVLTALDHLFDVKRGVAAKGSQQQDRDGFLASLYQNPSFSTMWSKLSACLKVIHERENMLNVATILLPLIESLMVVCKNTTASDEASDGDKDLVLSSPAPESPTASLFFTFTEEHRRILNELVRNNPKLMSGTFSLLVKNPKVLEFDNKRNFFNRSVHSRASPQHTRPSYPALQLSVRREHVFLDSFKHLYFKSGDEMKYGKLNIRFNGEEGVDAGGVSREWFQVMARQMFDPNYALFTPVSSDRTTFHPNNLSGINDEHLMFFKFIGRIIGKALYEGRVLDCYFSRAVYKRILGKSVSVKDMESFDPDYYKSLCWMLENDITDTIIETFSVEDDAFGVTSTIDLIPDGRNVPVTDANKAEYIRLVVEHKLLSSVKDQMESFLKGFHEIIPAELISIFNEQELELLISGLPDIDIDDWKSNTEYQNYTPSSPQIQWFWRAVRSFDKEERAKLLQFVTGTSKVPLNGFKELEGMNGVSRFNIHRAYGDKDRLPTSHTCFNQLDIPEYESYDALRSQFMKAITAGSEYFGFA